MTHQRARARALDRREPSIAREQGRTPRLRPPRMTWGGSRDRRVSANRPRAPAPAIRAEPDDDRDGRATRQPSWKSVCELLAIIRRPVVATSRRSPDAGAQPGKSTRIATAASARAVPGVARRGETGDASRFWSRAGFPESGPGAVAASFGWPTGQRDLSLTSLPSRFTTTSTLSPGLELSHAFHVVVDRSDLLASRSDDAIAVLEAGLVGRARRRGRR